ncbi:hypothetical protein PHMEG_00013941 [Phytophthora megakarya]|uniref:Uncharacterized protein n=1 Tax=Phytophthora megakarya TaxID=4795 RepID=A0A225W5I6_9STRA|nr:hypothetical protein PHMEG_00013941 [Phytophthora megakarya]
MFLRDNTEVFTEKGFHICSRLVVAILEKIALYPFHRKLLLNSIISLTCQRHLTLFRGYDAITQDELSVALRDNELRQQGRLAV